MTLSQGLFSQRWTDLKKVMERLESQCSTVGSCHHHRHEGSCLVLWETWLWCPQKPLSWMETARTKTGRGCGRSSQTSFPALPQPKPDLGYWEQETGREAGLIVVMVNNSPWVLVMTLRDSSCASISFTDSSPDPFKEDCPWILHAWLFVPCFNGKYLLFHKNVEILLSITWPTFKWVQHPLILEYSELQGIGRPVYSLPVPKWSVKPRPLQPGLLYG